MSGRLPGGWWPATLILATILGAACGPNGGGRDGGGGELTVYGAASLKGALAVVQPAYATATGESLTVATDASSTLRTQIEQGAPADVFLSADTDNPAALVDRGLTDGPAVAVAGNSLVVIVPLGNPARIRSADDLGRRGVRVVAAGREVPISRYAEMAIDRLAGLPGAPADLAAGYAANVVSREQNVAAVVAKIELGEGDAAIVYATDAVASPRVERIDLPAGAAVRATYAGVVVAASTHRAAGHAFLDWLAGPDGRAILGRFGFVGPP